MAKTRAFLFPLFLAMLLTSIAGCTESTATEEPPTVEPVVVNTPVPTLVVLSEPEVQNNCLECHTDKERLVDNEKPIIEVISENEGAG